MFRGRLEKPWLRFAVSDLPRRLERTLSLRRRVVDFSLCNFERVEFNWHPVRTDSGQKISDAFGGVTFENPTPIRLTDEKRSSPTCSNAAKNLSRSSSRRAKWYRANWSRYRAGRRSRATLIWI